MLGGLTQAGKLTMPCRTPETEGTQAGLLATSSDSMVGDSRVAHTPIWVERRQREQTGPESTKIPCFQAPDHKVHFPFWIQLVAAKGRYSLRQLKTVHTWPEEAGDIKATAPRLDGVSSGFTQAQDAVSTFNPEVEKCR